MPRSRFTLMNHRYEELNAIADELDQSAEALRRQAACLRQQADLLKAKLENTIEILNRPYPGVAGRPVRCHHPGSEPASVVKLMRRER